MKLRLLVFLPLMLLMVPLCSAAITYQPDILPEIGFTYDPDEYLFRLTYKSYYLNIQPYAVYDNQTYTLKQMVPFIKNQYPAITYRQVVEKFAKYHRWGFWLERLPDEVSSRLGEVGYRLVGTNIPRGWFEVEMDPLMNVSRVTVGGRFTLDFSDLEARYDVNIDAEGVHVTGITGLTDLDLDPITYSAPTITVTGYTEGVPCTFLDIYNADVAGGWGVVNNTCNTQFKFWARLVIGDGVTHTWFADTNKQVVFVAGLDFYLIEVKNAATLRLGEPVDVTNKIGMKGCEIITLENVLANRYIIKGQGTGTARADLYSTSFKAPYYATVAIYAVFDMRHSTPIKIWGCTFDGAVPYYVKADIYNCRILNHKVYGLLSIVPGSIMDKIFISNMPVADSYWGSSTCTFKNAQSIVRTIFIRMHSAGGILYAVNCNPSAWTFTWGAVNPIVYRQYTFNLNVTDSAGAPLAGANVTLTRADSTAAFTALTAADGTIAEQTVTRGYYTQPTGNTLNDHGPFTLTIEAAGYREYEQPGIVLSDPVNWGIALQPPHWGGFDIFNPLVWLIIGVPALMLLNAKKRSR